MFVYLQVNINLFLAILELGRSLAVSGDTPTSLPVTLVRFKGPIVDSATVDRLASCLKDSRSASAFSKDNKRVLHISHMYGEILSVLTRWTPSKSLILDTHLFLTAFALNKCTALLGCVTALHKQQTLVEAIHNPRGIIITVIHFTTLRRHCSWSSWKNRRMRNRWIPGPLFLPSAPPSCGAEKRDWVRG